MKQRIKILTSLLISFLVSSFVANYSQFPGSPHINTLRIASDVKETSLNVTEKISSFKIISSITLPNFFSSNISPTTLPNMNNENRVAPSSIITQTKPSVIPTGKRFVFPTSAVRKKTPTPTVKKIVSPTAKPTPTEIPIGRVRPGKNYNEMVEIVAKKTCVPAALIKAFAAIESGDKTQSKIAFLPQDRFIKYNTYDWWNDPSTSQAQVCEGIGYNHHTGLIPEGSQYAGARCMQAETFTTVDVFSMGYLSLSEYVENAYRKRVLDLLKVDKVDRRVFFDATVIAALHLKNTSTYRGDDCNNWEAKYIAKAACKYLSFCIYDMGKRTGDYCQEICDLYNGFTSGEKANCKNISSIFKNNGSGGCEFK